jgi:hypothetical protein
VSRTGVVAEPAVDPAFVRRAGPEQPSDPKLLYSPVGLTTYHADGSTLALSFYGGVCSTYSAKAVESADQVLVTVTAAEKQGIVCPLVAKRFTAKVKLDRPLGGRTVVDTSDGKPLTAR